VNPGEAPAIRPSEILQRLWATLAAPIATEVGAIVALIATALAGIVAGLVAVLLLGLVMPYLRPPDAVARIAILVAGPPLRYALLLVAVARIWLALDQGLVPALLLLLVLAFVIPLVGFLVAQARLRRR
jgi:hypothetical protein